VEAGLDFINGMFKINRREEVFFCRLGLKAAGLGQGSPVYVEYNDIIGKKLSEMIKWAAAWDRMGSRMKKSADGSAGSVGSIKC